MSRDFFHNLFKFCSFLTFATVNNVSSLFRTRLSKQFDDRTAQFHTSVVEDLRMFEYDVNGTEAHNIMLHEQGIIEEEDLSKILNALEEIKKEWKEGKLEIGAEYEDIHEYIEARVIDKIGIEAGGKIHTGRSRNDQVMVDMKMVTRADLLEIGEALIKLLDTLLDLANEHMESYMILYTHGQQAQIGTFAHYLVNYADGLMRDYERLRGCYERVNMNPLGAGPIGGTNVRINRLKTSELLGFDKVQENSIDATSNRDWAIETAYVCASILGNMSRAAADIILWSSKEFSYIELSDEYSSSSSIMPQKKNPSTIELIRGKTSVVYGALIELMVMVKGVPTGYYQDLQQTKIALWRTLDTTKTSLEVFNGAIKTMKVNIDTMKTAAENSQIGAIEIAERLIESGLSFREAYKVTAGVIKGAVDEGKTLKEITKADVVSKVFELTGKEVDISSSIIEKSTNPKDALEAKRSPGSAHPGETGRIVEERKETLERHKKDFEFLKIKIMISQDNLKNALNKYKQ